METLFAMDVSNCEIFCVFVFQKYFDMVFVGPLLSAVCMCVIFSSHNFSNNLIEIIACPSLLPPFDATAISFIPIKICGNRKTLARTQVMKSTNFMRALAHTKTHFVLLVNVSPVNKQWNLLRNERARNFLGFSVALWIEQFCSVISIAYRVFIEKNKEAPLHRCVFSEKKTKFRKGVEDEGVKKSSA